MDYRGVKYNNKHYTVVKIKFKDDDILFVFDQHKLNTVLKYKKWYYRTSGGYISCSQYVNKIKKELYLHNLVVGKLTFEGKGQLTSIDHINRVGTDNRLENLREISQTNQNFNQRKRRRIAKLPENSGLDIQDIPKHIWYIKPHGNHGPRFCVELKYLPNVGKYVWKTTSSKKISLRVKLEQAKKHLRKMRKIYNEYFNRHRILIGYNASQEMVDLVQSYNEILMLSGYECFESNLIDVPDLRDQLRKNYNDLTEKEIELVKNVKVPVLNIVA